MSDAAPDPPPPPGGDAAAAAAAARQNNDNNNNEQQQQAQQAPPQHDRALLRSVSQQIQALARQSGYRRHVVDRQRVQLLLDATAGPHQDLSFVAHLYWDDFVASSAFQHEQQQQEDNHGNNNNEDDPNEDDNNDDHNNNNDDDEDDGNPSFVIGQARNHPRRRTARRGRGANDRPAAPHNNDNDNHVDNDGDVIMNWNHRMVVHDGHEDDDDEDDHGVVRTRTVALTSQRPTALSSVLPQKRVADPNVQRLVAQAKKTLQKLEQEQQELQIKQEEEEDDDDEKVGQTTTDASTTVLRHDTSQKQSRDQKETQSLQPPSSVSLDQEEKGYLPDDDWVWEAVDQIDREKVPPTFPSTILWGGGRQQNNNEEQEENNEEESKASIPLTWLRVGFQLDDEHALGLVLPEPSVTDLGFEEWQRLSIQRRKKNRAAPPFHCRAITAVLSTVTALIHSGAQVVSDDTNNSSSSSSSSAMNTSGDGVIIIPPRSVQTPWTELTVLERRRQFDARLTQALTCLLVRAATTARKRKLRYLQNHHRRCRRRSQQYHKGEENVEEGEAAQDSVSTKLRRQAAQRKIERVCPVLGWPVEGENVAVPTANQPVVYSTSFTSIADLQLYVASQLPYFQKPGGVALLLETLVQIHGPSTLHALWNAQREAAKTSDAMPSSSLHHHTHQGLVHCDCIQRDLSVFAQPIPNTKKLEPHPDCVSVELLSLLLTGTIHTTWQNWSTDPLGIGVLSDRAILSKALTRPLVPVWILAGPTTYSVLWAHAQQPDYRIQNTAGGPENDSRRNNNQNNHAHVRESHAGTVVRLEHWNAWHEEHTLTKLRLSMGRHDWKPPMKAPAPVEDAFFTTTTNGAPSQTLRILEERRRQRCRLAEARQGLEVVDPNAVFTAAERAIVRPHPDDVKFYPDRFTLWRYNASSWPQSRNDDTDKDVKMEDCKPRSSWVPYHRLTPREKRLVENSLGPAIANILRTRWPTATLDDLQPNRPFPLV